MMTISFIILLGLAISSFSLYVTQSTKASSLLTLSFSKRSIAASNNVASTETDSSYNINNNDSKSSKSSKRDSSINTDISIEVNDDFRSGKKDYANH